MPKVLRIINRLNLGGPTYNVASLTAGLSPEFETLLIAGEKDPTEASSEFILREKGITPQYIKDMRREISLMHDRNAYKQIAKIIREFKPDIVHTHAAKAGTLGRLAAWNAKVPVIVHTFHGHVFHSYFSPLKTRIFIEIERRLSGISDAIVAISEEQRNDLVNIYKVAPAAKTHVIPLGFDLRKFGEQMEQKRESFRRHYQLEEGCVAIGIIGRIVPVKNHELFIRAWQKITTPFTQKIHAFLVGDGEDRLKAEKLCEELGIIYNTPESRKTGASLTFTSWIEDVDRVMAGMDIIALSSMNEGTPVSLIEAQAAGRPIVSTEVGGVRNAVLPNQSALLSPSGNVDLLAKNLLILISDPQLRTTMGLAGTAYVMKKFDSVRLVEDMRELYHSLLNKTRRH